MTINSIKIQEFYTKVHFAWETSYAIGLVIIYDEVTRLIIVEGFAFVATDKE